MTTLPIPDDRGPLSLRTVGQVTLSCEKKRREWLLRPRITVDLTDPDRVSRLGGERIAFPQPPSPAEDLLRRWA